MIIFMNGALNSGKSTVAEILVKNLKNTANLEIDSLRQFIAWMPLSQSIPLNLENAISIIKNFARREINAVVSYPLSEKDFHYFEENLKDLEEKIYAFTLNPKLDVVLKRGKRKLSDWEKKRIKYHYKIRINNPKFGITIDNTNQTPEETVKIILAYLEEH